MARVRVTHRECHLEFEGESGRRKRGEVEDDGESRLIFILTQISTSEAVQFLPSGTFLARESTAPLSRVKPTGYSSNRTESQSNEEREELQLLLSQTGAGESAFLISGSSYRIQVEWVVQSFPVGKGKEDESQSQLRIGDYTFCHEFDWD